MRSFYLLTILLLTPLSGHTDDKLHVFVSVLPQKFLVEQVGGTHVDAEALVTPGHSPATYNPTPRQIQRFASANVLFRTGVPFEDAWLSRLQSANPDLLLVDARDGVELLKLAAHGEHDHHANELDPHIWTSPQVARKMALQIKQVLTKLKPSASAEFEENFQQLDAKLDRLDKHITTLLKPYHGESFLVFHPSWGYFANSYDLVQVAIEHEGKQPNARMLAEQIAEAKAHDHKVIFIQSQFSRQSALAFANALKGRIVIINPLAEDYIQNLEKVSALIADSFKSTSPQ